MQVAGATYIAITVDVLSVGKCKAKPSVVAVQLFTFRLLHLTTVDCPIPPRRNALRTANTRQSSSSAE